MQLRGGVPKPIFRTLRIHSGYLEFVLTSSKEGNLNLGSDLVEVPE